MQRPRDPSRHATLAIWCSVLGVLLVALVASVPGSPLQPVLPDGVVPTGPFAWLARAVGLDRLDGAALAIAGVIAVTAAAASFLVVLRAAWQGRVSVRSVLVLTVAYHVVVLTLPLLFSRDVYSYAFYGRIAGIHGANPYVATPADFPGDPLFHLVGPKWLDTPAVYGPLFTGASALLSRWIGSVEALVATFRVLAVAASLGAVAAIYATSRRAWPLRSAFAVAAFGLNPVVLFQSAASGHNDLWVALGIAAGLWLLLGGRELAAVAVLALATLVKATAALPLLVLLVWCVARRPAGERLRASFTRAGLAAAIGLVVASPFLQLHDPTLGMSELAGHEGWLAPSRFVRRLLDALSGDALGIVTRLTFAALLVVSVVLLLRAVWRLAPRGGRPADADVVEVGAAWGWSLLLLMLLGPVLLPWYVVWALPLAWLLPRVPRAVLITVSSALAVSQWAAEPSRFPGAYDVNVLVGHYAITPVVIGALVWLLVDGRRRLRAGAAFADRQGDEPAAGRDERDDRRAGAAGER
ncbi:MAG TPA: glycosyltransferase 87 family protein [Actinomycetota bacterium]